MKSFGEAIRDLRNGAGLSQAELAEKIGSSQKAVSHWESNEREPGWNSVQRLCAALGVKCTHFEGMLAGEEGPQPDKRAPGRPAKPEPVPEPSPAKKPRKMKGE